MDSAASDLSTFLIAGVLIVWPLALGLIWWMRRRCAQKLDRLGECSSEEMLEELDAAYAPQGGITIRTQTEYLPFVVEAIREQIDRGLDDEKVRMLIERIDHQRPNLERHAVFPVEVDGDTSNLALQWVRDPQDRIELKVRAAPSIIRALRNHKKQIPRARRARVKG
jgi:hypothetical protein